MQILTCMPLIIPHSWITILLLAGYMWRWNDTTKGCCTLFIVANNLMHQLVARCLCMPEQNLFQSLETSTITWENVEWKSRYVNFRRVLDATRAFLPAFRVTGSPSDNPGSACNNSWSTSNLSRAVWTEKLIGNASCVPGNHGYYL